MPYSREFADKTSHRDIVNNPDVRDFLDGCKYIAQLDDTLIESLKGKFQEVPLIKNQLPDNIISLDGSNYEASICKEIPSTRVGYVKIGNILIKRNELINLGSQKFVDPFKIAALQENNSSTIFVFPSSNIRVGDEKNVRDSFRLTMDKLLDNTRSNPNDPSTSLRATLFKLASYRTGEFQPKEKGSLILHVCPSCKEKNISVKNTKDQNFCPKCSSKVYAADCLRIWEEVDDFTVNQTALTRFMNVIEHIFVIHYIRVIVENNSSSYVDILSNLSFFVDGPLAIFGNAAWLHNSILKYLFELNCEMKKNGKSEILILGLIKTGFVVDYFNLIQENISNNTIYCLEDEVRYKYISPNENPPETFGNETYYGQDFLFKTKTGRTFVFNIPYVVQDKKDLQKFKEQKTKLESYLNLTIYTGLIEELECDLYENATIPIALAHKYTAISLQPGAKVLDLLSKSKINQ